MTRKGSGSQGGRGSGNGSGSKDEGSNDDGLDDRQADESGQDAVRDEARREAHAFDLIIGRNIRAVRLERALSQEALAARLGLTFQQIQKYENGSNRITGGRLCQIAQACRIPIARLFVGVSDVGLDVPTDIARFAAQSARYGDLLDNLDSMPGRLQTQLRRMASTIADALRSTQR